MRQTRTRKVDLPEYVAALEDDQNICRDRWAEYADYSSLPSPDEADLLCISCPMMIACLKNAKHRRPKWGVWGGVAWVAGKPISHLVD